MNMKNLRIAEELVKIAESLIFAGNDYIYDPEHKKHPSGGYHKTEKGWSKSEEKKEKSNSKMEEKKEKSNSKMEDIKNFLTWIKEHKG